MPVGYLVQLGNNSLDPGDAIVGGQVTYTTYSNLGMGTWTWSGVSAVDGQTYNNITENGTYYLATDGNVYFTPTGQMITTNNGATASSTPPYTNPTPDILGTAGDEVISGTFDSNNIYGGSSTSETGTGNDTINAGGGTDTVTAGDGNDSIDAGGGADLIYGGAGHDTIIGGDSGGTVVATVTQSTTYNMFYFGNHADIDVNETDGGTSEFADDLRGTYGDANSPMYNRIVRVQANNTNGDTTLQDNDGGGTPETYTINGQTYALDSTQVYNATVFFTDGTSGTFTAVVVQLTNGDVYLAPEFAVNTDSTLLSSKPIAGFRLDSVNLDNSGLVLSRLDTAYTTPLGDTLYGGAGDDSILGGDGVDTLDGGTGNDTLRGEAGNDRVLAGDGHDLLSGGDGNDTMDGGEGSDTLSGGVGADSLIGGGGLDIVDYSASGAAVNVNLTTNAFSGGDAAGDVNGGGLDGIIGSRFNDTLVGFDASGGTGDAYYTNVIDGAAGNDNIDGMDGADTLSGGVGTDTVLGGAGNDVVYGDGSAFNPALAPSGAATTASSFTFINSADRPVQLYWINAQGALVSYGVIPAGGQVVQSTFLNQNWVVYDAATGVPLQFLGAPANASTQTYVEGNDSLRGGTGDDTIYGGGGNDTVFGDAGHDWADLGAGNDSFGTFSTDSEGNDTVLGGSGNDYIITGGQDDLVYGGTGNDTIAGGIGSDTLYGGDGMDAFLVTDEHDFDSIVGGEGVDDWDYISFGNFATTLGVNVLFSANEAGSYGFYGDAGTTGTFAEIEAINGTIYNDLLDARATTSAVTLNGGDGNDTLWGGDGTDALNGGTGVDVVNAGGGADTVTGGLGNDSLSGNLGNDVLQGDDGNDNLQGNEGDDALYGGIGADALDGGAGNDLVYGGGGADTIAASSGNDTLYGDDGNDSFTSGTGSHLIYAGLGNDSATLGTGNDIAYGGDGNDIITAGAGNDTLYGDLGRDTLTGGADRDVFYGGSADVIDGSETGEDYDILHVTNVASVTYGGGINESGTIRFNDNTTLSFANIEGIYINGVRYSITDGIVRGTAAGDLIDGAFVDNDRDRVDYEDAHLPGHAPNDDLILAGLGNDTVYAGLGNDTVQGGGGDDQILSGVGDDSVLGEDGHDTITSGSGNDYIDGGAGNDSVIGGDTDTGNDSIYGGTGFDTLTGGLGADVIEGGADNDFLFGARLDSLADGSDTLRGDGGNDFLQGQAGADMLYGGTGEDTIYGDGASASIGANDTAYGGDGNDTAFMGGGNDVAHGEIGNDLLNGEDGDDQLFGGTGADSLYGGLGADALDGGDDADVIHGSSGDVVVGGEGGTDNDTLVATNVIRVIYGGGNDEAGTLYFNDGGSLVFSQIETLHLNGGNPDGIIFGTSGADSIGAGYVDANGDVIDNGDAIFGTPGSDDDEVYGGDGNDTIASLAGNDSVYGGNNDDQITSGTGNDYVQGDAGNDQIDGEGGDDFIRGDAGNDFVYGGTGHDQVYGGADSDHVYGGDGMDTVYGGFGQDTVYGGADNDTVTGSGGSDAVHGDDGDDFLQGSDGDDTLYGGIGSDTMLGEEDADTFYGGAGDYVDGYETVLTGTDNDTLHVSDVDFITFDKLNPENGVVHFTGGGVLAFYNIEAVYADGVRVFPPDFVVEGTAGGDLIDASYTGDPEGDLIDANDNFVGNNDDLVLAGAGNDTILSGAGADTVQGEAGDDLALGGGGNDLLYGGADDDTLNGGGGDDLLSGGDGADRLVLDGTLSADTLEGGEGGLDADTVDLGGLSNGVIVTLTADEAGTLTDGVTTASFSQIEGFALTGQADVLDASAANSAVQVDAGAGNDTLLGGAGADTMAGGAGDDRFVLASGFGADQITGGETVEAAGDTLDLSGITGPTRIDLTSQNPEAGSVTAGGDTLTFAQIENITLGAGVDTLELADGSGDDRVLGFVAPTFEVDGSYTGVDQLDVSALTDAGGDPVNTADVVVTDTNGDGTGDAVLTFPNGESLTLVGVSPAAVSAPEALVAMGIPVAPDGVVDGTASGDAMGPGYTDVHGDQIDGSDGDADTILGYDGNDTISAGAGGDLVQGGAGEDVIDGGLGDDTLFGGTGNDTLTVSSGADQVQGGADADRIILQAGAGIGGSVDGGNTGVDNDTLDLTGWGKPLTNILYGGGDNESGTVEFLDGNGDVIGSMTFTDIEHVIPCFTTGTRILTDQGEVAVQDLAVGDLVLTRDNGFQPVRWAGRRVVTAADLAQRTDFAPVQIAKGALGGGLPMRDMMVSPQHRMLVTGSQAEMFFGEHEVLVAATHLLGQPGITRGAVERVEYFHLLFDQHEIIRGDGAWSESFQPGDQTLAGMDQAQRDEILTLFPDLGGDVRQGGGFYPAARLSLRAHEARVLMAAGILRQG